MTKKNILIISAFFYPQNVIATSRVGQWVKYWAKDGHNVFVLTTKKYPLWTLDCNINLPSNVRIIETDYLPSWVVNRINNGNPNNNENITKGSNGLRKIKESINYLLDIDIHDFWPLTAIKAGEQILLNNNIDLIISSFSPASSHIIANKLKTKHPNIKWIADFRDLWADNHLSSQNKMTMYFSKKKEKKILKNANVLTTVSQPLAQTLINNYPTKKIITVENGFDPDDYPNINKKSLQPTIKDKKIIITYTGIIYKGKRDPSPLFSAVNELIEENKIKKEFIEINFYGRSKEIINEIIITENYNRHGIIHNHDIIPKNQSIELQKNSDLLLLLEWNDPSAQGVLTGKVFEYIASGTPILGVGITNKTSAGKLLEDTGTGVSTTSVTEIKEIILNAMTHQKFGFYKPNVEKILTYRRDDQARKMLNL